MLTIHQSYVACFTAPIIAVGFSASDRQAAVSNRILAAVVGVVIFMFCENVDGGVKIRFKQW